MYKDLKFDYKQKDKKFGPYERGGKFRSINTKVMLDNLKRSMNVYGEAGSPVNQDDTNQLLN